MDSRADVGTLFIGQYALDWFPIMDQQVNLQDGISQINQATDEEENLKPKTKAPAQP